jgi:hypothetical protein
MLKYFCDQWYSKLKHNFMGKLKLEFDVNWRKSCLVFEMLFNFKSSKMILGNKMKFIEIN